MIYLTKIVCLLPILSLLLQYNNFNGDTMKKEKIQAEAIRYSKMTESVNDDSIAEAFMNGAAWRINNVWHDREEQPTEDKPILKDCLHWDDHIFHVAKGDSIRTRFNWDSWTKAESLVRWAYIDDLIP